MVEADVVEQFRAAMAEHGLVTDEQLTGDGKLHRFYVDGDSRGKDNGWYVLHIDDRPAGAFGSWKHGVDETWVAKVERKLTAAERRDLEIRMSEQRRLREEEERRVNDENAARAADIWRKSQPASTDHPYLVRKSIRPCNVRQSFSDLVVPIRDASGKLWSLQFIMANGEKRFLSGGKKHGCYFTIYKIKPDPEATIALCEGFATGASVHAATDWPVVVAFDSGNLDPVARAIREKFPKAKIVICADNDQWTKRPIDNPGLTAAKAVCESIGGYLAVPEFKHASETNKITDFNDLAASEGLPRVAEIIEAAISVTPAEEMISTLISDTDLVVRRDAQVESDELTLPSPPSQDFTVEWPFRCLGCGVDQNYYYLKGTVNQVTAYSAAQHTRNALLHLAPLQFWEAEFPKRDGVHWDMASNTLMRFCERAGIFSPTQIRGRGTWHDESRIVLHLGDRILIGTESAKPKDIKSRFVYEEAPRLDLDTENPLSAKEAIKLFDVMKLVPWGEKAARLASGWVMCAHIGGALKWRPHIWVTGPKGAGKSYVMSEIIQRAMGDNVTFIVSESTEAGIRQMLGNDALPVLFDEAEGEDKRASDRVQRILALARQASCETGAKIAKGTPGGRALTYQIRSCFALSSINPVLHQEADKSRFCVIEVDKEKFPDRFSELRQAVIETFNADYSKRLFARAVKLADVIRQNAETFAEVCAHTMKDRRAGDQYGALLAGNYALHSERVITIDAAREWLSQQNWTEEVKEEVQGMSDEQKCLAHLMSSKIRLDGSKEAPVGALIDIALAGPFLVDRSPETRSIEHINENEARFALAMHGIEAEAGKKYFDVARQHPVLKKLFEDTPYVHDWGTVLRRLKGTETTNVKSWGSRDLKGRAIRIILLN